MSKRLMEKKKMAAKKKLDKERAMKTPGFKSRYAKRHEARTRGEPMSARDVQPWWTGKNIAPVGA